MKNTKDPFKRLLVLTFLSAAIFLVSGNSCNPGGTYNPGPTGGPDETRESCCSETPAPGFVKVNDDWNPNKCGNPSSITRNVCFFQRYDNKPVGTTLNVCSSATVPAGWVKVVNSENWDPTRCGSPSSNTSKNVMLIQRNS